MGSGSAAVSPRFGRPRGPEQVGETTRRSQRRVPGGTRESFDAMGWRGAARALHRGGADEARESLCGRTVGASRVQEDEWHLRSAYRELILGENA
mmetsp:Transcript_132120/g.422702  ORF Transcript_132120/g.422702 Transcript_132120/m.422702 type:complete len:95 (+) Transcript_132120:286-570(+)